MRELFIIRTPENVAFEYELAGIAARAVAWSVDICIIATLSVISSLAFSPMMWAPNNSPCFLPNNNLAKPSGSPEAMALPMAANGILPTL